MGRIYYRKHKKEILRKNKIYRKTHKRPYRKSKKYLKYWSTTNKGRFSKAKSRLKSRWKLSFKQYEELINQLCFYCEGELNKQGSGLDRKNNSNRYYTVDNVVPCCKNCNIIKNEILTHEEMIVAMKAILKLRRGKR